MALPLKINKFCKFTTIRFIIRLRKMWIIILSEFENFLFFIDDGKVMKNQAI